MGYRSVTPRPRVLDLVAIASFVMSVLNVVWTAVLGVVVLILGTGSWLAGPVIGLLGMTIAGVVLAVLLVQSILSLVLFAAAWQTWNGLPGGRSLHRFWAWSIILMDLIDLAFTGGMEPGAWVRLIYAVVLIVIMNRDDVRDAFEQPSRTPHRKVLADDAWP